MKYELKHLANGLPVIYVPMPDLPSATLTVWVRVGSRFEREKEAGISHFLEHLVFKGSKKRPSARQIAEEVDALGGEFNASTAKEWTSFYIKARAKVLDKAFDVLSDMVLNPLLKADDIERERGVILEEMAMYEDTPMAKISDYFENLIFKGNSLARDIIGSRKTVKQISRDDFVRYRKRHYGSNNMLITVAGGLKKDKALALAEKYFSELGKINPAKPQKAKINQKKPRVLLISKKNEQAHLILGFPAGSMASQDRFSEAILCAIMGQGMSSRLFSEVREKRGLAYAVKSSVERYVDSGYLATYAGVEVKRIDEAIKVIIEEHEKMAQGKSLTEKELKKAKEFTKGHLALSLEDTRSVNSFFGIRQLLLGQIETPSEVFAKIDQVSKEDVLRVAKKIFVRSKINLAIIGPYQDKARFERLLT